MRFDDDFDEEELPDPAEYPTLVAVARFTRLIPAVPWFAAVGETIGLQDRQEAESYCSALGFPGADVALVPDWHEAENVARNPDWNDSWWEQEEQLRVGLIADACEFLPEHELMTALTHVTSVASDHVHGAAAIAAQHGGIGDEALVRAAAGAATQACYQAALVLAAGADDEHCFAIKYRLFEAGRWPLGIIGSTFSLF
ncbi:hypothetical protein [Oceanibacterium hippocampi]|uniref:Uncharacterized protein n=1 Tax=Oceanibacterium hippocampi TaxID=745714 RepID=A0A1Y5RIV1_9PROT|nr:hypothetical protein [Oceanibacterium hippocampi]SLN17470.1 hypothetical protein OCH7691_00353 [Oceanibacterium hippocampi]